MCGDRAAKTIDHLSTSILINGEMYKVAIVYNSICPPVEIENIENIGPLSRLTLTIF